MSTIATVDRAGLPKPAPDLPSARDTVTPRPCCSPRWSSASPTDMLFVGVSPADMTAARASGAVALAAGWGQFSSDIRDFDYRVETPNDILDLL